MLLLRLSAILPFTILNYSLGLTKISFKQYCLVSSIGMIPGTLLYVYLGSLSGQIMLGGEPVQKTLWEWALIAFGFAATLVMGFYSTWMVKKAFGLGRNPK